MTNQSSEPKILLDADVISHFVKGGKIIELPKIYPNRLVVLDIVKNEVCKSKPLKTPFNNFISFFRIEVKAFPTDISIKIEYARLLKSSFGPGESACMAVAKFEKQYIASSNLKDIKTYCENNGIVYLTTMDILLDALDQGILTEKECDQFISEVKRNQSRLPTDTIAEYRKMKGL